MQKLNNIQKKQQNSNATNEITQQIKKSQTWKTNVTN